MAILSSVTNRIVSIYIIIEYLNCFLFSQYHVLLHSFLEQHLVTLNAVYIKVQFYSKHLLCLMKRWYITFVCGPPWLKTNCWGVLVGRPPPEALLYKSHFCTVVLQYSIFIELKWTFEEERVHICPMCSCMYTCLQRPCGYRAKRCGANKAVVQHNWRSS